jgi:hypothetical protein
VLKWHPPAPTSYRFEIRTAAGPSRMLQ